MEDIDDSLYSRQRCVLGDDAMRKLSRSKVFLLGLGGVGVEIAKNLVLGGVEELIIQDNTICSTTDLGTQFFIRESDINSHKTRAEATLPHLIALNPYVRITVETRDLNGIRGALSDDCNAEIFRALWKEDLADDQQIKCLIATQCLLNTAATLNLFCRKHDIRFIYTDVYGVFGNLFCDFGQTFVIRDPFGEPPKEFFIGQMEKVSANQLNVKVYGDRRHYLEPGQMIRFSELCGMTELNDQTFVVVQVVSPSEFAITVDTDSLSPYTGGGVGTQVIVPQLESYESMLKQLREPTIVTTDLSRPDEGHVLHLMYLALSKFRQDKGRYPEPWDESDWALLRQDFHVLLDLFPDKVDILNEDLIKRLAFVSRGQLAPLCAFFGAVAAQEAMKAVSGSFTPFKQWLYMQCDAVIPKDLNPELLQLCQSRYDPLEICVGPHCLRGLQSLSAFLVGCGAIGCELLKNLALLGVATAGHEQTAPAAVDPTERTSTCPYSTPGVSSHAGDLDADAVAVKVRSCHTRAHLVVTDPDHIEKSNLNRQFLFRPEHIGQSKSQMAALAAQQINPLMDIRPMEQKISQSTEKTVFTDKFLLEATGSEAPNHNPKYQCTPLRQTGVVLAALDCVPSRRYLDQRCVSLQLPLFESGTLGTKGHVQVVLPGWTESYNSQFDDDSGAGDGNPGAGSIPYCTLKSFPSLPVHCVEWAREKFASQFTLKPNKLSQLMASAGSNGPNWLVQLASELLGLSPSASGSVTEVPEQEGQKDAEKRAQINWLRNLLTRSLARFLASRPTDWDGCVRLGRDKFERYFNHKARRLLHAFPPGTKLADGTPFWQLPKRQPTPLEFDAANALHRLFVLSYARLLADQLQLTIPEIARGPIDQVSEAHVLQCLHDYVPPQFVPSKKRIVVDENESAPPPGLEDDKEEDEEASVPQAVPTGGDGESNPGTSYSALMLDQHTIENLRLLIATLHEPDRVKVICACRPVKFEKDDDNLAHVDFIAAAANLRATMYGLPVTPRHEVRRIAGRIVPAIATTTAAVAGLVSMELVKLIAAREQARSTADVNPSAAPLTGTLQARNAFLNLALPVILLSEPGMCAKNRLPNGMEFTLWDMCVIPAPDNWDSYRLSEFLSDLKRRYELQVAVVTQTSRMIYVSCLPMHKTRLNKSLKELLSYQAQDSYVDLMVAYDAGPDQDPNADYVRGPPVRLLLPTPVGSESMPPALND